MTTRDSLSDGALAAFQQALEEAVQGEVRFDRATRAMHSTDASVYQILPLGVVTPKSQDDVIRTVQLCREHGVSITARGGGTSQAGQAIGAGISLDFSRHMNRLLELNIAGQSVVVEPGLVLDELNAVLKGYGLQLPLDLSTSNRATIGGMIANNSAGTRSVVYGKTLDYVEALDVVLSDGSLVRMEAVDEDLLGAKSARSDLEGSIYRSVQQLAAGHAAEIERRYPKILRRVGGYNLDEFVPSHSQEWVEGSQGQPRVRSYGLHLPGTSAERSPLAADRAFNLSRIMVGSEGTLGLNVKAKLRLVPLPKARVLCAVQFQELLEAMAATPVILEHGPSAVELVDRFILGTTRGRVEFEPLRDFIVGDPGAVLLVEFDDEEPERLIARLDRLDAALRGAGLGHHFHRAVEPAAQARIWTLRRAALGLTMSVKGGDAKGISFVEDTAVAPDKLHDYIENFRRILAKYDTHAGFYAHASVGLLHVRPVVDMKSVEGVQRFEAIAGEVSDLVLEYGGAISGEHGDGLVRAPFQEKMFGTELYDAFCQLKLAFDPTNLLNPGKIVHAPALTASLRYGAGYVTPDYETTFDFSDFGGLLRAAEQCSGVGACRKTLTGTMCPSYMATRNEKDSTRGRANALRQALAGRLDVAGMTDHALKPVMELCLECKACKSECPTGVDMARLKSEYQHQYRRRHGTPFRERLLARMEQVSLWGSRVAPFSNWLLGQGVVRRFNEEILGLDRRRPLPPFAARPFTSQWTPSPSSVSTGPTVALFADTFNNYYEPEHLFASASLLAAAGADVEVAPRVCCGRPLISKGFLDEAARQAAATTRALRPMIERGLPILFCEPSCHSAVRDDHPLLLKGEMRTDARRVADACFLVDEWVARSDVTPIYRTGPKTVLVHAHCHQKALVGTDALVQNLAQIPDCRVALADSGCCGLAGLFGYEHYEISQTIGEQRLFPAVRGVGEDGVVVSPGFSCRQQIKHFTGIEAQSPGSLLVSLLASV